MKLYESHRSLDRRAFLKSLSLTGAAIVLKSYGGVDVLAQTISPGTDKQIDLVAVMGGNPVEMFQRGIAEAGGISRYIKPGYKVVIKPNIAWDRTPDAAGNTNPELVAEIIRQCYVAEAGEVAVFDHTCDQWRNSYKKSGIENAAREAGAKVLPAHDIAYYREIDLPHGRKLKKAMVHEALLDSDAWINVPILKHHGGANLTISMKNHMGIVWDRRFFHRNDLQQCIADICTLDKKAVLNVVDAFRTLKTNGPRGKSEADVVTTKALFLSPDIVAVDTAAAKFFNQVREMPLKKMRHLAEGQALELGSMDLDKLNIKRIKI